MSEKMTMYYLYRYDSSKEQYKDIQSQEENWSIRDFCPNPLKLKVPSERVSAKTILSRLYFWCITKGKFSIKHLYIGDELAHCAYVVPKCF